MFDFQTKRCVICNEKATVYCGHVHLQTDEHNIEVLAGLCKKHSLRKESFSYNFKHNCVGCYEDWKQEYGLELVDIHTGKAILYVTN